MKFRDLSVSKKLVLLFSGVGLVTLLTGAASVWAANAVAQRGIEANARLAPLGYAATEIKLTAVQAHLIFEEIMSGDEGESIDEVWALLEESRLYANAILDGAEINEVTLIPTDSPVVREHVRQAQEYIEIFAEAARARYATLGSGHGTGSAMDVEFDALYDGLTDRIAAAAGPVPGDAAVQALAGDACYRLAHGHILVEEMLAGDAGEDFN